MREAKNRTAHSVPANQGPSSVGFNFNRSHRRGACMCAISVAEVKNAALVCHELREFNYILCAMVLSNDMLSINIQSRKHGIIHRTIICFFFCSFENSFFFFLFRCICDEASPPVIILMEFFVVCQQHKTATAALPATFPHSNAIMRFAFE